MRDLLSGGDRRSIARSERVHAVVHADPRRLADLVHLAGDDDWLVSMRALDLLDKLAHEHPEWVQPHRSLFIGPLADSDKWEIRLQIVRTLPLLDWSARERVRVLDVLRRDVEHPKIFVRAWALDGLATFAGSDPTLRELVGRHLEAFARSGSKALAARARQIRARLAHCAV